MSDGLVKYWYWNGCTVSVYLSGRIYIDSMFVRTDLPALRELIEECEQLIVNPPIVNVVALDYEELISEYDKLKNRYQPPHKTGCAAWSFNGTCHCGLDEAAADLNKFKVKHFDLLLGML